MPISYQTTAVIFLDVLGTKGRTSFEEKFAIHKIFHEEVERNMARQEQSPHVAYKRDLRSFSDCAYIFYTYKEEIEESRKDDLNLLYICLYNTSLSILRILHAGFLVRGGAALGDCFIDDLGFFGPSVECAHYLESTQAHYPRILIEDEIGQKLFEWERSRELDKTMASMFSTTPRLIIQDEAGHFYLNTFYELEKSELMQIGELDLTLGDMKVRISETLDRDEATTEDVRVLEKLSWMRKFTHESEIRLNPQFVRGSSSIVLGP